MREDPPGRGWFAEGQDGDRTLAEQLLGLEPLMELAPAATVLDLGCAEGLIGIEMIRAGASFVHGLDRVRVRIEKAKRAGLGLYAEFLVADLALFDSAPPPELLPLYDIVLLLSIVHKMRDPGTFLAAACRRSRGIVAIRLPDRVLVDPRSRSIPYDIPALMAAEGLALVHDTTGPRGEWVGIFDRA